MKKRWFALCMCIVMLAGILTSCGTNTGKIKFGAAGLGGTYRVFGDTFANLVTSKNKKHKMEVEQRLVLQRIFVCFRMVISKWRLHRQT